jgi:hypothetical protein
MIVQIYEIQTPEEPRCWMAAIAAVRPAGVDSKTKTDRAGGNGKDLGARFVAAAKLTTSRQ